MDTQTQGIVMGGHPQIVQGGLGILGVRGYSDTGCWTSLDSPGWSGYPWCTWKLRHRVSVMASDTPG